MKKRGMQRRVDKDSMTTEKRGMVFRERPAFFMMTPPISIPTATAGRFTAPGNHKKGNRCLLKTSKRVSYTS